MKRSPPPLKFSVNWDPEYVWTGDHFYGQSISQVYELCVEYGYSLVGLEYNNAFLTPKEIGNFPALTPEEAYRLGYLERQDRRRKFPWNSNMEVLLSLTPEEGVKFINHHFAKYEGKYTCLY